MITKDQIVAFFFDPKLTNKDKWIRSAYVAGGVVGGLILFHAIMALILLIISHVPIITTVAVAVVSVLLLTVIVRLALDNLKKYFVTE